MSSQRVRITKFWSIAVLLIVGSLFTTIVTRFIRQIEYRNLQVEFIHVATNNLRLMRSNLTWHYELAESVAAFYAASQAVDRAEFTAFITPLLQKRHGIQAVAWIPYVPADQRLRYEANLPTGASGVAAAPAIFTEYAGATLLPAKPRAAYYPIYYQVALGDHPLPLGFDLGSEPAVLATLNAARQHGRQVIIDRSLLSQTTNPEQFTLQLLYPLLPTGALTTTATGLLQVAGFISLSLQVDSVVADALRDGASDDIHLDIYDLPQKRHRYHYPPLAVDLHDPADPLPTSQPAADALLVQEVLTVGDQEWLVVLQPTPAYLAKKQPWFHWFVLISSLLLTIALAAYLYLLLNRKHQSEILVSEQTEQLRQANQQLEGTLQELQFQKTLLECTTEAMQGGILVVSPERKWIFFNRRFLEIWQVPPAIAAQRSSAEGMRWVLAQVENAPQVESRIETLYAQPDTHGASEVRLKNGSVLERFSAPVKSADDVYLGRVWYFHDVTQHKRTEEALRQSEARNRAFVNAIPDLLFRVSRTGSFLDYHSAPGYLPVMPPEKFLGRNADEVFPPPVAQALKERIISVLSTGESKIIEYDMPMLNGEMRSWEQRMVMLSEAEVLLIIRDITARKQAEVALRSSQQQLQERQQREKDLVEAELARLRNQLVVSTRFATLGQVAATIAHELRNPLGAVRNAVYYIRRYLAQDHQELLDFLQIIDVEITTSDRIITDLLEVTRAKEPGIQPLDLCEIAQEIWRQSKETNKIDFRCTVAQQPFRLFADPTQFRQVLANLMTNAIQAMPDGGSLCITGVEQDEYVMITVQDSGGGVPLALRERIFEPLFTTKAKGTGLGLAICRQIIERHGGTIELSNSNALSDSSQGTTFVIRLPIKPVATMMPTLS